MNSAVGGIGPIPVADGEIGLDAVLSCARQYLVTIAFVAFAFEMGVRVDEHSRWPFVDGRWRNRVATGAVARPGRAKLGSVWVRTPVVPPGLDSLVPLSPALKRWAKLVRPSGAAFSSSSFHRIAKTSVLTHTLKRWAKLVRPSEAVCSSSSFRRIAKFHRIAKTPVLSHTKGRGARSRSA